MYYIQHNVYETTKHQKHNIFCNNKHFIIMNVIKESFTYKVSILSLYRPLHTKCSLLRCSVLYKQKKHCHYTDFVADWILWRVRSSIGYSVLREVDIGIRQISNAPKRAANLQFRNPWNHQSFSPFCMFVAHVISGLKVLCRHLRQLWKGQIITLLLNGVDRWYM